MFQISQKNVKSEIFFPPLGWNLGPWKCQAFVVSVEKEVNNGSVVVSAMKTVQCKRRQ